MSFRTVIGFFILLLLSSSSKAATTTTFLDWLRQPNSLAEAIQPGSRSWIVLAPSKDIILRQELIYSREKKKNDEITRIAAQLGFFQLKKYSQTEALRFFLESEKAARETGQPEEIINAGLQVALVHRTLGAYSKSNEVLSRLRPYLDKLKDAETNGIVYALMADNFGWTNELSSCTEAYRRSARAFAQAGKLRQAAVCHISLGENQLRLEAYDEAEVSFNTALELTKDPLLRSVIYRNAGLIHFKKQDFEEAVREFNRSRELIDNFLTNKLLKESYMQLFTLYSYQNKFETADRFHSLYRQQKAKLDTTVLRQNSNERLKILRLLQLKREQRDSIVIADQQLELSRMIDKRDLELRTKEQALLAKTNEADSLSILSVKQKLDLTIKQAEISNYRNTRNMLFAFSVIVVLLLLLFYSRYSLKRKSEKILAKSNTELKLTLEQLRNTQDQLIYSEKMAGLGKLTAGIAHEIQNPLNFVRNFSESGIELFDEFKKADAKEQTELIPEINETFDRIRHHANRADAIVKSMLQHSRPGSAVLEPVDLNALLQDSVQLAYHSMRATVSNFQCRIEEELGILPEVEVYPQQISRVFLNMVNNAFYAMYEQEQQNSSGVSPILKITTSQKEGKVYVVLKDNGPGIPPENLSNVFEPFFTTKPAGKGTGLGLSISYDVIRQHGGDLFAESTKGEGAVFTVVLPLDRHALG